MKTYYLYRHIRHDKNEVFYIGVGTVKPNARSFETRYTRAHQRKPTNRQNKHWLNIVNISDYSIEIMLESPDRDFILKKEIEFIKLYGRADLKKGTLVNWCDGGQGPTGTKWTEEMRKECSRRMKGRTSGNKGKPCKLGNSRQVFVYDLEGILIGSFNSIKETARKLELGRDNIRGSLKRGHVHKNLRFYFDYKGVKIEPIINYVPYAKRNKVS